jgi:hypothetical protein
MWVDIKVGYFAANAGIIPPNLRAPPATLMRNAGQNLGNLVFWHAVRRMFDNEIVPVAWDAQASELAGIDHLVFPAANYLNPQWDFGDQATLIDKLGHETLVFGLGAQSDNEDAHLDLRPGTVRFLKALSAHSRTIFVRGDYTAEICASYGVKNVQPLGCPSITLSADRRLGRTMLERASAPVTSLYFAGGVLKGNTIAAERKLYEEVLAREGSSFVLQHPTDLVELASGSRIKPSELFGILNYHDFFDRETSFRHFHRGFTRVARWYADVPTWLAEAARHSHAVNTRMHGAVMSLTAGVPTIILAHDARIREMCRVMALPHIDPADLGDQLDDLDMLFADMPFDADVFDRRRQEIAGIYLDYLAGAGLTVSATLSALAGVDDEAIFAPPVNAFA